MHIVLLAHQIDDRVRGHGIELARVGVLKTCDVPRILHDRHLHAEADAEIGHRLLARPPRSPHLALDAPHAETTRHENAIEVRETALDLLGRKALGVKPVDVDLVVVEHSRVIERFVHRQIGIGQRHVLAHQRDVHGLVE